MFAILLAISLACTGDPPPPTTPDDGDDGDDGGTLTFETLKPGAPLVFSPGPAPTRVDLPTDGATRLWGARDGRAILTRADTQDAVLIDLIDHKILTTLDRPRDVRWDAGLLTTRPTGEKFDTLVTLADGAIHRPEIQLNGGAEPYASFLLLGGGGDGVTLLARGEDGSVWYSPWADLSTKTITLDRPFPTWPIRSVLNGRGQSEVRTADGVPGDGATAPCVRWRLDGASPKCVAVKTEDPTAQRLELSGGWSAVSSWNTGVQLYRDTQPVPWRLGDDCQWQLSAVLAQPPRVIAECQPDRSTPERRRVLWSPDGEVAWTRALPPDERGMFRSRRVRDSVLPEPLPGVSPRLAGRWIDLDGRRGWRSPMLHPLRADTSPDPTLARDPETGKLALLDLKAGVMLGMQNVGEDCPVELIEWDRTDTLIVLSCRSQPRTDVYVFQQMFAVIIDLERQRTWKIEEMPEAVLDGRRLLVSDRTEDRAEGEARFARLTLIQLPQ
ncbi:MAG: hypothetical protein AAFV53_37255 [Myxococcota bacterium]